MDAMIPAPPPELSAIAKRGYPVDRQELETMYRHYVCPNSCPLVVDMCRTSEMTRLVFIALYRGMYKSHTSRGRIIERIRTALGVSRASGWRYAAQYDRTRVRAVK